MNRYSFQKTRGDITLLATINDRGEIEEINFKTSTDLTAKEKQSLNSFCHSAKGLKLEDALEITCPPIFPHKMWHPLNQSMRAIGREFWQIPPPHNELIGERSEDLICRCFAVYRREIEMHQENNAGNGCGKCRQDIATIVSHKIEGAVKTFVKHSFPQVNITIAGIEGKSMVVSFTGERQKKYFVPLKNLLKQTLSKKYLLNLERTLVEDKTILHLINKFLAG